MEKLLDNYSLLNFPFAEEKKAPLLQMPMSKKREMITMNTKTMARTQYESPNDYIQYLVSKMKFASFAILGYYHSQSFVEPF